MTGDQPGADKPPVTCPACNAEDSLELKHDAWACYSVLGLSPNNELILSEDFDTQVFDDHHLECSNCGERLTETAVLAHLRSCLL
jgi:hypothetical protein